MNGGTESFSIRPLRNPEEMKAAEEVQREVWGSVDRDVVPSVELISAAKGGGCVAGAWQGGEMIGFVYGSWGLDDGRIYHYSRMLAVKRSWRSKGIGATLKLYQRRHSIERGVNLMRWTFDPLEGPNAALNFGKLGVVAGDYLVNFYGMKTDALNRDLPTDRLFVKWFLDSERVERRIQASEKPVSAAAIMAQSPALLSAAIEAGGLPRPSAAPFPEGAADLHVEIPGDIQEIKASNAELSAQWRTAVRDALTRAFDRGFQAEEFASEEIGGTRRNVYLLRAR